MADPNFKGLNGAFDRNRFDVLLRNAGYTEARYTAEQRRQTLRREIAETVSGEITPPKAIADAYNRYENEQRAIDYVVLDKSKAGEIGAPTPEQISAYYEANKAQFRAPEFRSIVLLAVTPTELARAADISDDDARKFYEANKSRFGTPERRQVQQIVFPNEAEAAAAAEKLQKNELTFAALATERGLTDKDIDLGLVSKTQLVDRAVADAAFALQEGAISAPVKGTFGTALVHVTKIEAEQMKPFETVAAEIKQTIAVERARNEIASRHDKIEDERAGGMRLTEIAQKLGLTARVIEAIDRQGRDPAGQPVTGFPESTSVLNSAFTTDVGVENEPLQVPGGGYIWVEVAGIKPARERPLDEVRAEVVQRWQDEQVTAKLKATATALLDKLKGGTPLADAAQAEGVQVRTTFGLKRAGSAGGLAAPVIDAVFRTQKGEFGLAQATPTEWVVFHLTDIAAPAFNAASPEAKRLEDTTRRSLSEDLIGQYVLRLQTDYGASINQDALRRVASGSDQQQ
jgi:peptidyl-prolyl cis-trans isomerase D